MLALKITNLKRFTKQLFLQDVFDGFQFMEGQITTFNTFQIDGFLNREYYSDVELEEIGSRTYSMWKQMRPLCFQIIKGNKLPLSFKIVLRMKEDNVQKILRQKDLEQQFQVESLLLNIVYKNGIMTCTTGISLKQFTMDRTLDREWDLLVRKFFLQNEVEYTES